MDGGEPMRKDKNNMIELLTGVKSSKKSYYIELKRTIEALEKKNMKLEIINDVTKGFNVNMPMEDMLKNVLEKLEQIIVVDRISLSILEKEELVLTDFYPEDAFHLRPGTIIPKQRSIYWEAIHHKKVITYNVPKDNKENKYVEESALRRLHIQFLLLIPLCMKEKVIGVLSLGSNRDMTLSQDDVSFLQQLADQLAVCIENAHLYQAVLRGKEEWEETFQAVRDMLIYVDMDHRIVRYNQAVKEFFQRDDDEIKGKKCHDLLFSNEEDCPLATSYCTKQMDYRQLTLHNDRICDIYTYPVLNEAEEMNGVIIYIKDVTEHVQTQAQLIQSGKLVALGEMAAGVAHELNSPLTAIIGNSQLLLRELKKSDASYPLVYDINECGKRSRRIIRNLLTFSRQEEYQFEPCSLHQAIEEVITLVGYQITKQHIDIEVELHPSLPSIYGNIQQLEQVVINLLLNAKDAFDEVERDNQQIRIKTTVQEKEEKDFVALIIEDNGKGMTKKELKNIFHPFYTTKEKLKGTGLGLSVSLGIVKAHQGFIDVKSKLGNGSTFTLFFPIYEGVEEN